MSLFHYITYKLVVIKDKRLGVIYYSFAFMIIMFTLVEIFVNKGYLEFDMSPEATMRLVVSDGTSSVQDSDSEQSFPSYCCQDMPSKTCTICQDLDAQELHWPVETQTVSLMTFGKDRWQSNQLNRSQPNRFVTIREKMYYTLRPEKVFIKIEHSVVATRLLRGRGQDSVVAASQRSIKGYLYGMNGETLKSLSTETLQGKADKISIDDLLLAANVTTLDLPSDALNAKGKTFRRHGIVLHVTVSYQNAENTWFGTGPIEYAYHVRRIPYADYRINQLLPVVSAKEFNATQSKAALDTEPKLRLFRKRYGIKLEFQQLGKLGRFCFSSFLLKLVSGVGLLTLTATIVDTAALYILPDKFTYRGCVYEESPELERKKRN